MDRLQYRKGGLIKLLLKKGDTLFSIARENQIIRNFLLTSGGII